MKIIHDLDRNKLAIVLEDKEEIELVYQIFNHSDSIVENNGSLMADLSIKLNVSVEEAEYLSRRKLAEFWDKTYNMLKEYEITK